MIRIRFNDSGEASGIPDEITPGDLQAFELSSHDEDIDDSGACEISLVLERPEMVVNGNWTLSFGASSSTVRAEDATAYAIHTALNRMDSIISAGGVSVTGENGVFIVSFLSNGSRSTPTLSHSSLGSVSNRFRVVVAGGASVKAVFELDLTVQTLARSTTATDITGATVTIANVATGNSTTAQRDTITISRRPDRGKMQIWTSADIATGWITADASAYEVQAELDNVEPDSFVVSQQKRGEAFILDIRRTEAGTNPAPTVSNTFLGPEGVSMSLELGLVQSLLKLIGSRPNRARLVFRFNDKTKFSAPINLSPLFYDQAQPL